MFQVCFPFHEILSSHQILGRRSGCESPYGAYSALSSLGEGVVTKNPEETLWTPRVGGRVSETPRYSCQALLIAPAVGCPRGLCYSPQRRSPLADPKKGNCQDTFLTGWLHMGGASELNIQRICPELPLCARSGAELRGVQVRQACGPRGADILAGETESEDVM